MQRFDEIELRPVPIMEIGGEAAAPPSGPVEALSPAPRGRRLLALITDLSMFLALSLALSPLLPVQRDALAMAGLAGFVVMTAYYYFVGSWLLWGKTVGASIFDVRIVAADDQAMSVREASLRFAGVIVSLLTAGIGFLAGVPDRMSGTRSIAG
jgi:uncharacterized RDD family membrane protein YckC